MVVAGEFCRPVCVVYYVFEAVVACGAVFVCGVVGYRSCRLFLGSSVVESSRLVRSFFVYTFCFHCRFFVLAFIGSVFPFGRCVDDSCEGCQGDCGSGARCGSLSNVYYLSGFVYLCGCVFQDGFSCADFCFWSKCFLASYVSVTCGRCWHGGHLVGYANRLYYGESCY